MITVKGAEPKKIEIEDGLHTGTIKVLEERTPEGKDYSYLDIYITIIEMNQEEKEIKVGYPMPKKGEGLNTNMELGKLVERFTGAQIEIGKEYDLTKTISGSVSFQTISNDKGYAEIIKRSLKPYKKTGA